MKRLATIVVCLTSCLTTTSLAQQFQEVRRTRKLGQTRRSTGQTQRVDKRLENAFRDAATKLYEDFLSSQSSADKNLLCQRFSCEPSGLAAAMADSFMITGSRALQVSPREAEALLAGHYHDAQNRQKVEAAGKILSSVGFELPEFTKFVIQSANSLEGMKLELATRIVADQANLLRRTLDRLERQRRQDSLKRKEEEKANPSAKRPSPTFRRGDRPSDT
ncbi:MAG: hypothetical protein AAF517_12285 [Planctomycetota bacterium]